MSARSSCAMVTHLCDHHFMPQNLSSKSSRWITYSSDKAGVDIFDFTDSDINYSFYKDAKMKEMISETKELTNDQGSRIYWAVRFGLKVDPLSEGRRTQSELNKLGLEAFDLEARELETWSFGVLRCETNLSDIVSRLFA